MSSKSKKATTRSKVAATPVEAKLQTSVEQEQIENLLQAVNGNAKEIERAELHKTIWNIANDLRGSVDGWDFKAYVLGILFYRFISENLTEYLNEGEHRAGNTTFDYASLKDSDAEFGREETVKEKGFYILPSDLFANVRANARVNPDLNETLSRAFKNIESSAVGSDSEHDIKGLFDDLDVNSGKLGPTVAKRNEKLVKLLEKIGELKLAHNGNTIDAFGDAYEFLMAMYASGAGKSGGEFFTPQEVSELLARITVIGKTEISSVYDPACGSGSLLLKFDKILGHDKVRQGYFGQEINLTTYNLCRINMFLHGVNYEKFDIVHGDTLTDPGHGEDQTFEAIVSNPPYSIKWDSDSNPLLINDPRFAPAGVLAPKKYADLAFTMHILNALAVNGTAAIVEFPGVLYRPGSEAKIRKYLVDGNFVDTVIQLPPDLFFGTPISTCIIVLKKNKTDNKIHFINASDEFVRQGIKNKLTDQNQQVILKIVEERKEVPFKSVLVDHATIAAANYSLAVASYVHREVIESDLDIEALNVSLAAATAKRYELASELDSKILGIDELDELLSLDAISYVRLADVARRNKGISITARKMKELAADDGVIRVFAAGANFANVPVDAVPQDRVITDPSIIVKSRGNIGFEYYAGAFTHKSEIWSYTITSDDVIDKYVYYYLLTQVERLQGIARATSVKLPQLGVGDTDNLLIPIPSLEVQKEIVDLFEAFSELRQELVSELAARTQQQSHYQGRLFDFPGALE